MGENIRNSGILGEEYVENFLKKIGWTTSQFGIEISCNESEKHNKKRPTHGLDGLYSYESPLDTDILIHAVVSSKHTKNEYLSSPNAEFKKYLKDLADTMECFENYELIDEHRENYNFNDEHIVGVLFWLSSKSDRNYSVISNLNPSIKDNLNYRRIHIMDNARVEFITKSINLINEKFSNYEVSFQYIDTPYNNSDKLKKYSGKILPIEMLSSDIQLFKLQKDDEIILAMVIKDEFDSNNLKRILGLAHRVSNNLTSNVHIFFPGFAHEERKNKNVVQLIKDKFKEKSFIDTTYIFGYDIGFKDTDENINLSNQIPKEKIEEQKLDDGKFLPYGEYLRSLLNHSIITESELKNFLKEKGIYVCNPIKENTIYVLSSLILSPNEFDNLKEYQKTREDKEKTLSSRLETAIEPTKENLKKVLKTIDLNEIAKDKSLNYKFKTPKVNYKFDDSKKQITLIYEIERYYKNKSWDEQINYFIGKILIDYSNKSEIIYKNIYTSKETLESGQKIINNSKGKLKDSGIISKTAKEQKILMGDMSNEEVFQFLLAFTDNNTLENIKFEYIISIDIEIDDKITLPDDNTIKWMEDKIKKLKLDGEKIEDTEIITKSENHKYLKCWGIAVKYKYNNQKAKGSSIVRLEFNKLYKGEFVVIIEKYTFDKKLFTKSAIDEIITLDIDNIKHTKHKKILETRKKTSTNTN